MTHDIPPLCFSLLVPLAEVSGCVPICTAATWRSLAAADGDALDTSNPRGWRGCEHAC